MQYSPFKFEANESKMKSYPFSHNKKLVQSPNSRSLSFPTVLPPIDLAFHLLARRNGFSNFYSSLANLMNLNPYLTRSILSQRLNEEKKDQETPLDLSAKKFKTPFQFDLARQMFAKVDCSRRLQFQNPFENFQNNHSGYPGMIPPVMQNYHHLNSMIERNGNNLTPQNNIISPILSKNSLSSYKNKSSRISNNMTISKSSRRTSGGGKQPVTSCLQCSTSFASLIDLNTHFLNEHELCLIKELELAKSWKSHAVEEICMQELEAVVKQGEIETTGYQCPHCEYFAKWPTELQKHIMVHSKERPHQCIICGLTYKWKWDLGRHFDKSHLPAVNPYKKNPNSSAHHDKRSDLNSFRIVTTSSPNFNSSVSICSPNFLMSSSESGLRHQKQSLLETGSWKLLKSLSNSNPNHSPNDSSNVPEQNTNQNCSSKILSIPSYVMS